MVNKLYKIGQNVICLIAAIFFLAPITARAAEYGSGLYGDGSYNVGTVVSAPTPTQTTSQGSGSSASSRIYNLVNMGNLQLAQQLLDQYPNAIVGTCPVGLVCKQIQATTTSTLTQNLVSSYKFVSFISKGMTSNEVRELQSLLASLGYFKASPSGYFGSITEQAVKDFQKAHNIESVGYVGPQTRTALNSKTIEDSIQTTPANTKILNLSFNRDLMVGFKGEDVRLLQKFLNNNGYIVSISGPGSAGNETDMFGGLTKQALARFQSTNNIHPPIGYLGPITREFILKNY